MDLTDTPEGWNRNAHYHDRLLAALPVDCRRVLDAGTLREISDECASLLPGVVIRRHALLRYSLIWTKP